MLLPSATVWAMVPKSYRRAWLLTLRLSRGWGGVGKVSGGVFTHEVLLNTSELEFSILADLSDCLWLCLKQQFKVPGGLSFGYYIILLGNFRSHVYKDRVILRGVIERNRLPNLILDCCLLLDCFC